MDLRLVAAEFEGSLLPAERLPDAAAALMSQGHDSPSLRIAAGADHDDPEDQRRVFRQALIELGELPLSEAEVGSRLCRLWAERIESGKVSPLQGARGMWILEIEYGVVLPDAMSQYGALDEDDFPTSDAGQQYERDIRLAAHRWLASNPE